MPISYLIAGVAALFSAMCYAEFGARVPKAGSAYTYTYVAIGEFWSFTIGWTILLEHLVGVASIARAFGGTINSLADDKIREWVTENIGKYWLSVVDCPLIPLSLVIPGSLGQDGSLVLIVCLSRTFNCVFFKYLSDILG